MNTNLPDNPLSSSGIKERSRIMTDGQPLKERREAEKAELFQKGRVRARVTQEKKCWLKKAGLSLSWFLKAALWPLNQTQLLSTASFGNTFHPQRALSAASGASHPSSVACWWIRPWWCSWARSLSSHHCHNLMKDKIYKDLILATEMFDKQMKLISHLHHPRFRCLTLHCHTVWIPGGPRAHEPRSWGTCHPHPLLPRGCHHGSTSH